MKTPTYDDLADHYARLHRLQHLASIAGWDQAANMPPKGNEARAAALAELAALMHRLRTEQYPAGSPRPRRAGAAGRASARQPARDPPRLALCQCACRPSWSSVVSWPTRAANTPGARSGRPTTGPASSSIRRPVLAIAREEAALLAQQTGLAKYDALMDRFEPGMTSAEVDRVFGDVRQWLPGLIRRVVDKQSREPVQRAGGPVRDRGPARAVPAA